MNVGNLALIQKLFRLRRRSELTKAGKVRAELLGKQQYMMSQLEQYKQYVNHCLANLNKAGNNKRVHFTTLYDEDQKSKAQKLRSKVNTLFRLVDTEQKASLIG